MTSWHLVVGARLLVREIHADAKTMEPFAHAKVQNAKIKQDRMPIQYRGVLREAENLENNK